MSVGHPRTGKSPAIENVLAALRDVDTITKETLVSATTSLGLVKTISKQGKAFIASPELFDILNKLLKNDEDNVTGDVQLLSKLWSGKSASYYFATEATREIESNTAFSLLASTQIQNAALLIFRMDKGHGLLDRFLISVPNARKPTPEQQEEEATEYLERLQLKDFQPVFTSVHAAHRDITRSYRLNAAAAELHKPLKTDHVNAVNTAIENGEVPPKYKGTDLVTRVAVAFNAIDYFIASLLNQEPVNNPPEQITEACYKKAVQYVEYLHAQKEMFAHFIKEIVETSNEKPHTQPTEFDIAAILRFPGRLVPYQAFKKFSSRCLRSVQKQEYHHCTQTLQHYGCVVELRVPRCAQKVHVFIKKPAGEIINWPADAPCSQEQHNERISEP